MPDEYDQAGEDYGQADDGNDYTRGGYDANAGGGYQLADDGNVSFYPGFNPTPGGTAGRGGYERTGIGDEYDLAGYNPNPGRTAGRTDYEPTDTGDDYRRGGYGASSGAGGYELAEDGNVRFRSHYGPAAGSNPNPGGADQRTSDYSWEDPTSYADVPAPAPQRSAGFYDELRPGDPVARSQFADPAWSEQEHQYDDGRGGSYQYQQSRFFPAAVEITGTTSERLADATAGRYPSFPDVVRSLTTATDAQLVRLGDWLSSAAGAWDSTYEQLLTTQSPPLAWNRFMQSVADLHPITRSTVYRAVLAYDNAASELRAFLPDIHIPSTGQVLHDSAALTERPAGDADDSPAGETAPAGEASTPRPASEQPDPAHTPGNTTDTGGDVSGSDSDETDDVPGIWSDDDADSRSYTSDTTTATTHSDSGDGGGHGLPGTTTTGGLSLTDFLTGATQTEVSPPSYTGFTDAVRRVSPAAAQFLQKLGSPDSSVPNLFYATPAGSPRPTAPGRAVTEAARQIPDVAVLWWGPTEFGARPTDADIRSLHDLLERFVQARLDRTGRSNGLPVVATNGVVDTGTARVLDQYGVVAWDADTEAATVTGRPEYRVRIGSGRRDGTAFPGTPAGLRAAVEQARPRVVVEPASEPEMQILLAPDGKRQRELMSAAPEIATTSQFLERVTAMGERGPSVPALRLLKPAATLLQAGLGDTTDAYVSGSAQERPAALFHAATRLWEQGMDTTALGDLVKADAADVIDDRSPEDRAMAATRDWWASFLEAFQRAHEGHFGSDEADLFVAANKNRIPEGSRYHIYDEMANQMQQLDDMGKQKMQYFQAAISNC